ncbi:hypothetical protein IWW45_009106, partial [Coemansia sp. RSA 485]
LAGLARLAAARKKPHGPTALQLHRYTAPRRHRRAKQAETPADLALPARVCSRSFWAAWPEMADF